MSLGSIEDRLAVRERIEAYGDAVFRRDSEAWIANWAEDGVWRLLGAEFRGRPQIQSAWLKAMEAYALVGFYCAPGYLRLDGLRADVRVYTREILIDHKGSAVNVMGVYQDQLIKQDGAWLFAERAYTVLHSDASN
ncbi:nuclear transport factor 2 family protein [Phenylobacterium montanum]|uniref:Nuclear transport factor 2 family protein n=1 Tax=Phenylobacterium montanum TaxID=2823693 RepID=A0A975IX10_9CAUL|nr:nuclear transport factor 2 family protein [Caulobacter sp. S6]QUD90405.1 nuclear transport factor 2 family protein [Caulobacter sp. S6]